jgi:hypothetical protein
MKTSTPESAEQHEANAADQDEDDSQAGYQEDTDPDAQMNVDEDDENSGDAPAFAKRKMKTTKRRKSGRPSRAVVISRIIQDEKQCRDLFGNEPMIKSQMAAVLAKEKEVSCNSKSSNLVGSVTVSLSVALEKGLPGHLLCYERHGKTYYQVAPSLD